MPRQNLQQWSMNGGEWSPRMYGRSDLQKYLSALRTLQNFTLHPTGSAQRRSGFRFVHRTKHADRKVRLVRFLFSTEEAYILEFGHLYVRVFKDEGVVQAATNTFDGRVTGSGGDIILAADTIEMDPHFYVSGQGPMELVVGAITPLPTGLSAGVDYYVEAVDSGTIALHLSQVDAEAGNVATRVNITAGGGIGPHTIRPKTGSVVPTEIVTPYTEDQIFDLGFTQSADVLYICHELHAPKTLSRLDHDAWLLQDIAFVDGPYLAQNTTPTTMTASAFTGAGITITASSVVGVNDGQGFLATDVGRLIRISRFTVATTTGYAIITARTTALIVVATVIRDFEAGSAGVALDDWWLGAWYTDNYPTCATFHEQRLCFAGEPDSPETFHASRSGDFTNFAPDGSFEAPNDGSINDDNGLDFSLGANDVQVIRWMSSVRNLILGATGGEWPMQASSALEALTPTNVNTRRSSTEGVARVAPEAVGDAVVYLGRDRRTLRAIDYRFDRDSYLSQDLTLLAEHMLASGVTQIGFAQEPDRTIWCTCNNGTLAGLTFLAHEEVSGWHRHVCGGDDVAVESVAVIPSPDESHDQTWISVRRTIDGQIVRSVEFLEELYQTVLVQDVDDAFFVDSGLSLDGAGDMDPVTVSAATQTSPVQITTASPHSYSGGDRVRLTHLLGMTEVNQIPFEVKAGTVTATTFELVEAGTGLGDGPDIDGTAFGEYDGGGQVRKAASVITGLDHLEGETVQVLADGSVRSDAVVSGGQITLGDPATEVHVGLGYVSDLEPLDLNPQDPLGSSHGALRNVVRVLVRVLESREFKAGPNADHLDLVTLLETTDATEIPTPTFSGILSIPIEGDWNREKRILFRQDLPLPLEITTFVPKTDESPE